MNIKHSVPSAFLAIIFLYSIIGCSHYIKSVDEDICTKCVNFIKDGKTKKEDVLQKTDFYELFKTFKSKNDTILIFSFLYLKDKKSSTVIDKIEAEYHLVLVFDENDLLKKHSLVRVW